MGWRSKSSSPFKRLLVKGRTFCSRQDIWEHLKKTITLRIQWFSHSLWISVEGTRRKLTFCDCSFSCCLLDTADTDGRNLRRTLGTKLEGRLRDFLKERLVHWSGSASHSGYVCTSTPSITRFEAKNSHAYKFCSCWFRSLSFHTLLIVKTSRSALGKAFRVSVKKKKGYVPVFFEPFGILLVEKNSSGSFAERALGLWLTNVHITHTRL